MTATIKELDEALDDLDLISQASDMDTIDATPSIHDALAFHGSCVDRARNEWVPRSDDILVNSLRTRESLFNAARMAIEASASKDSVMAVEAARTLVTRMVASSVQILIDNGLDRDAAFEKFESTSVAWISDPDDTPWPVVKDRPWDTIAAAIHVWIVQMRMNASQILNPTCRQQATTLMVSSASYFSLVVGSLGLPATITS